MHLQTYVLGPPIVILKIIAAAKITNAIPIGTVHFSISSLLPYLPESAKPMKLPMELMIDRRIMQSSRSLLESPPMPASLRIDGPKIIMMFIPVNYYITWSMKPI